MHKVKCVYCGKVFDRDKEPFVQISTRRYAHRSCHLSEDEKQKEEYADKVKLENYILKLFNLTYIEPRIQKQIQKYVEENHYTYSGIQRTLEYFYEVKGNDIAKANGGIGIVPYAYQNAFRYYKDLWEAQQRNDNKDVTLFIPQIKEIVIPNPEKKVKKRSIFSFLDEEESDAF